MACRESRLRYTFTGREKQDGALWPVESPGFDTLRQREVPDAVQLWPVESPGFDTLLAPLG